jgi:hypothetical protein
MLPGGVCSLPTVRNCLSFVLSVRTFCLSVCVGVSNRQRLKTSTPRTDRDQHGLSGRYISRPEPYRHTGRQTATPAASEHSTSMTRSSEQKKAAVPGDLDCNGRERLTRLSPRAFGLTTPWTLISRSPHCVFTGLNSLCSI